MHIADEARIHQQSRRQEHDGQQTGAGRRPGTHEKAGFI